MKHPTLNVEGCETWRAPKKTTHYEVKDPAGKWIPFQYWMYEMFHTKYGDASPGQLASGVANLLGYLVEAGVVDITKAYTFVGTQMPEWREFDDEK